LEVSNKRNTIQRQLIYNAVKELDIHATAEQVVEYLAEKHPAIGRATVYRNLSYLSETGELLKICNFYGTTHYDHNCFEHYHFVCNNCKRIFDIFDTDNKLSNMLETFDDTNGFDVLAYNVSFSGLCWECKE